MATELRGARNVNSPEALALGTGHSRRYWLPVVGAVSLLLGLSLALESPDPWSLYTALILVVGGAGALTFAVATVTFPRSPPSEAPGVSRAAAEETRPQDRWDEKDAFAGFSGGSLRSKNVSRRSSSHVSARSPGLDSARPGDYLWQAWATPVRRLPVALVGPVPETAYSPPSRGAPVLHAEGEPIFIGPRAGEEPPGRPVHILADSLDPLGPLPSMIPVTPEAESDDDWGGAEPHGPVFSGPGSSALGTEVGERILQDAIDRVGRPDGSRPIDERVARPGSTGQGKGPGPGAGRERHRASALGGTSTLARPGSGTTLAKSGGVTWVPGTGRDIREKRPILPAPLSQGSYGTAVTIGDLAPAEIVTLISLLHRAPASRARTVPAHPQHLAHEPHRPVLCVDCRQPVTHSKGTRRCPACLRRLCPECAFIAPRTREGSWCSHCARIQHVEALSSELARRSQKSVGPAPSSEVSLEAPLLAS